MRLFIAINFTDEIRDALCGVSDELRALGAHGNFSRRENLHLTLSFLGETPPERLAAAIAAMDAAVFSPFTLTLGKPGRFSSDEGDLLWIGAARSHALEALQGSLTRELIKRGFTPDKKPFRPHITIGRRILGAPRIPESASGVSQRVESIELMSSERIAGQLTYKALYSRRA